MKQIICLLLFSFYFFLGKSFAQVDSTKKNKDSIFVNKDSRLDILTQKQILLNKQAQMQLSNGLYKGYRLQLLSSNNRNQAFKLKYDLLSNYPDYKSYVIYQAPYFKVRMGNFIKREEAEKLRGLLNKSYKSGVYIVEDAIEYKHNNTLESTNK